MYLLSGEPAPYCRIVANATQLRRQVAGPARPSDFAWPQPESEPQSHTGGTPSDLAERRLKTTVVEDRGPIS